MSAWPQQCTQSFSEAVTLHQKRSTFQKQNINHTISVLCISKSMYMKFSAVSAESEASYKSVVSTHVCHEQNMLVSFKSWIIIVAVFSHIHFYLWLFIYLFVNRAICYAICKFVSFILVFCKLILYVDFVYILLLLVFLS